MKIIKDKKIIEDDWTHIADDEEIKNGNITVSLSRWKKEKIALSNHKDALGIRLSPADNVEEIAGNLQDLSLIALEFPVYTDGRLFSHARLLRSHFGYRGEIRAMGNYMPDQVFYLSRVGVNSFQLNNPEELPLALSTMEDFTVKYQASTD
jgi:uncharacterized protein (DUF934 family)